MNNEQNTVYSEYAEYAFFWEIFGGKSNAVATFSHLRFWTQKRVRKRSGSQVTSAMSISEGMSVLLEIEIPCIVIPKPE